MDALQHFKAWVAGEAAQGRVMMVLGVSLAAAALLIFKSEDPLLRGMLLPVIVLTAMNLGYGSVLIYRPTTSQKIEAAFRLNPAQTTGRQIQKATDDASYYTRARPAWAALTAVSVLLFFVFSGDYYRGLSLGLTAMFLGALFIDSFLHQRLLAYLEALQGLGASIR